MNDLTTAKLHRLENIFWIGHDLASARRPLEQGDGERLMGVLDSALDNVEHAGLRTTQPGRRLERLRERLNQSRLSEWTQQRRGALTEDLERVIRSFGELIPRDAREQAPRQHPQVDHEPTAPQGRYAIKAGYQARMNAAEYPDTEENASSYQVAVYEYAAALVRDRELRSVVDVGCGYGLKLLEFLHPACPEIVGIDQEHSIAYCKSKHAGVGQWLVDDFERPQLQFDRTFDLVIASDIIEHLQDPDLLLDYIKRLSGDDTLVLFSTPERDLVRGADCMGPPKNPAHVREWNQNELTAYLLGRGWCVERHFLAAARRGRADKTCQVVLCNSDSARRESGGNSL